MQEDFQNPHSNQEEDFLNSFDPEKFVNILKRSWPILIVFFVLCVSSAYLYVRYTKPVYESESILKLDFQSEANTLGLASTLQAADLNELSGEIVILKSKLFLSQVVDAVGLDVSYYYYGRYLTDERYKNNPFVVSYKLKNGSFYDMPFDVEILDSNNFILSYRHGGNDISNPYQFGQPITTDHFNFLIDKTDSFNENAIGNYYFVINSENSLIRFFQRNLDVRPENFNAKTIRIALKDFNKYKAQDLVTAIDTIYLAFTKEAKNLAIEQKIGFLEKQIKSTESNLEGFEDYFESFTIENRTTNLQSDISRTIVALNRLDSQSYNVKERLLDVQLIAKQLETENQILMNAFVLQKLPSTISQSLSKFQALINERSLKISSYNENTFVIKQLDSELKMIRNNLYSLVSDYKKDLNDALKGIQTRRQFLESSFVELPSMSTAYNKNRRLYTLQENFLLSLRQTKMDLEITRAGTVTNFVVLASASLPGSPIKPQRNLILAVGASLSIVLSIVFLLVKYLLNNQISGIKELEKLTRVPVIGSVPTYKSEKLSVSKLVIKPSSKSALSESLRTIRTNMEFLNGTKSSEGGQLITVTSTVSGEGKTFVAVNLGAVIAFSNQKVCIVDLDMRKPKVNLAFERAGFSEGTSTVLIGKSKLEDCIQHSDVENLHFIPAGPNPPNPSELILNQQYQAMIDRLKSIYDVVILDTPPVGLVTDAVLSMKKSDIQFYVVRANYSKRSYTKSIDKLKSMNQFSQLSVIFNGVASSASYGYGYGYGYGQSYGYYEDSV